MAVILVVVVVIVVVIVVVVVDIDVSHSITIRFEKKSVTRVKRSEKQETKKSCHGDHVVNEIQLRNKKWINLNH